MKMKNIIIRLFAAAVLLCTFLHPVRAASWKLHPTFDAEVMKVIDTPQRVYIQAKSIPQTTSGKYVELYSSLFVYDKEGDELLPYHSQNYLNGNIVSSIAYNSKERYLMVVYSDSGIDILYDNGEVYNIPGLKYAVINFSKRVNSITFSPENNEAYLATDFGYIVINDKKHEIAESHIYGKKLLLAGRCADNVLIMESQNLMSAKVTDPKLNISEFKSCGVSGVTEIMPLDNGKFAYVGSNALYIGSFNDAGNFLKESEQKLNGYQSLTANKNGFLLIDNKNYYQLATDGSISLSSAHTAGSTSKVGSWDLGEIWECAPRTGLCSFRLANGQKTVTRDFMRPDAPSVFHSTSMAYVPGYGMVAGNTAYRVYMIYASPTALFDIYKNGSWTPVGLPYTLPERTKAVQAPSGIVIDPDNPNYFYTGSRYSGLTRFNLNDMSDILHMSHPKDPDAGNKGFEAIIPTAEKWNILCNFTKPTFDRDGNLWVTIDNTCHTDGTGSIWVWPAQDRKTSNTKGWKNFNIDGFTSSFTSQIVGLKSSSWNGALVFTSGLYGEGIKILWPNSTPADTSDDKIADLSIPYDQDGIKFALSRIHNMLEDPSTGTLWVCTAEGVFTVNPRTINSGVYRVNRIKVARNDGTNLADYLLDGVPVHNITIDRDGNKWFATGGGIVCTSPDGGKILRELTAENSELPHNTVWDLVYNPDNNSIVASTDYGIAEYFITGSGNVAGEDEVKAYPNPVRPDYLGWVKIEGLPDNATVKILDASGALVKELDRAEGGETRWDVTNISGSRVKTGVYYVASSASSDGSNFSNVTKILVVN